MVQTPELNCLLVMSKVNPYLSSQSPRSKGQSGANRTCSRRARSFDSVRRPPRHAHPGPGDA